MVFEGVEHGGFCLVGFGHGVAPLPLGYPVGNGPDVRSYGFDLLHRAQSYAVRGRLMNQISVKNTKPQNPMNRISATPSPAPASQAL